VKLDVVVPTYNRSGLLRRTITSLLRAPVPEGLDVTLLICDNNSKDDTEQVIREFQSEGGRAVVYVKETNQGLSHSRNAGIRAGTSEIIGFIDDDEEIREDWYTVVAREFADPETQFIGGCCLANWEVPPPDWLPPGYHSVIGVVEPKPRAAFNDDFKGNLMGGNAVIRRTVFDRVGGYDTKLGRGAKGLLSDEDAEFYRRLRAANLHGMYVPDLAMYHYIPATRLTRKYHRRWCYWRGVSQGLSDKVSREDTSYLLGMPRYKIGRAAKGVLGLPRRFFSQKRPGEAFAQELAIWDLLGFVRGKYFINIDRYYGKQ
jgi:glucosyl-dolichyl phosphate glucuronosyltransferase